jgi:hypothetical protein
MRLFEPAHNACEFARLLRRLRTGRSDWAIAPHRAGGCASFPHHAATPGIATRLRP